MQSNAAQVNHDEFIMNRFYYFVHLINEGMLNNCVILVNDIY